MYPFHSKNFYSVLKPHSLILDSASSIRNPKVLMVVLNCSNCFFFSSCTKVKKIFTFLRSDGILIMKDDTSCTKFLSILMVKMVQGKLLRMEGAVTWRLLRIIIWSHMKVWSVHFGSRWISRLHVAWFASRFGFVLLFDLLKIGCWWWWVDLSYLWYVHLTNNYSTIDTKHQQNKWNQYVEW